MKLIDLSYLKHNMTSIEEVEVENYRHILEFVENFEVSKDGIVNLDFLKLPPIILGLTREDDNEEVNISKAISESSTIHGLISFRIGDHAGIMIFTTKDKVQFLNDREANNYEYIEELKELLEDEKLPYVIVPKSLSVPEKEAVYHSFMILSHHKKF